MSELAKRPAGVPAEGTPGAAGAALLPARRRSPRIRLPGHSR